MAHRYVTVDVFTERPFGGNPLAVFPDARSLSGPVMQIIARELNLSETAFVLPAEDPAHTRRVRIFTPEEELPFAGHPTLGTAYALAAIGELPLAGEQTRIVLEEEAGPVPVTIEAFGGEPGFCRFTSPRPPERGPAPPHPGDLAAMVGLEAGDLDPELAPEYCSCGVPFLFLPLASVDALERARLDLPVWERLLGEAWGREVLLFAPGGVDGRADYRARMFAPRLGVPEDPATGAAAAAFAGIMGRRAGIENGGAAWTLEQGVEMGRPSLLHVEAEIRDGDVVTARVGGAAVMMSDGEFHHPEA